MKAWFLSFPEEIHENWKCKTFSEACQVKVWVIRDRQMGGREYYPVQTMIGYGHGSQSILGKPKEIKVISRAYGTVSCLNGRDLVGLRIPVHIPPS